MKTRIITTLLLSMVWSATLTAQTESIEYTVKELGGGQVVCETSKIMRQPSKDSNNNTYKSSLWLVQTPGVPLALCLNITTVGDAEVVAIARMATSGSLTTNADVVFSNGDKAAFTASVTDMTNPDLKNRTKTGALSIGLVLTSGEVILRLLRTQDIRSITIGGHTVNMDYTGVKSAAIVDGLHKKLQGATPTGNTDGQAATIDKSAVELTYHPLGILPEYNKDMTFNWVMTFLKNNTQWDLKYGPNPSIQYFSFSPSLSKYNVTWRNTKMEHATFYAADASEYSAGSWGYHFSFKLAQHPKEYCIDFAKQYIDELTKAGFSVEDNPNNWNGELLLNKTLRKGAYSVDIKIRLLPSWDATHLYIDTKL